MEESVMQEGLEQYYNNSKNPNIQRLRSYFMHSLDLPLQTKLPPNEYCRCEFCAEIIMGERWEWNKIWVTCKNGNVWLCEKCKPKWELMNIVRDNEDRTSC